MRRWGRKQRPQYKDTAMGQDDVTGWRAVTLRNLSVERRDRYLVGVYHTNLVRRARAGRLAVPFVFSSGCSSIFLGIGVTRMGWRALLRPRVLLR